MPRLDHLIVDISMIPFQSVLYNLAKRFGMRTAASQERHKYVVLLILLYFITSPCTLDHGSPLMCTISVLQQASPLPSRDTKRTPFR
jgi:hypothetical protein